MRIVFLSVFIVLADQAAKLFVKGIELPWLGLRLPGYPYGSSFPILGDFLRFTYIENPGMAFGIDIGGKLFFSLFSVAASAAILYYLYRAKDEPFLLRLSLALILGGAVGNLIDRVFYGVIFNEAPLFYGRVVDFIDVDFFNISVFGYALHRWPVFNIADASVTCGVFLMIFSHRKAVRLSSGSSGKGDVVTAPASPDTAAPDPPSR